MIFNHTISSKVTFDAALGDFIIWITIEYDDAFEQRQKMIYSMIDPAISSFAKERIKITGTATTGAVVQQGMVIQIHDVANQITVSDLPTRSIFTICRNVDKQLPRLGHLVFFYEMMNPITEKMDYIASTRIFKSPDLTSINVLILNETLDINNPLRTIRINPFIKELFNG